MSAPSNLHHGADTHLAVDAGSATSGPPESDSTDSLLPARRAFWTVRRVIALSGLLWLAVWAKVGVNFAFGIDVTVDRARRFPSLLPSGDPLTDWSIWSILPVAIGHVVHATTRVSYAVVQTLLLIGGLATVLADVGRRSGVDVARRALLALFATSVPAYLVFSTGSYDQLLTVLLFAGALSTGRRWPIAIGLLIGLTHAELGGLAAVMLLVLAAAGVGPPVSARLRLLAGVLAARVALTVWFNARGLHHDRFAFIRAYGLDTLLGQLPDSWPVALWSVMCGGWIIVAGFAADTRSRRCTVALAVCLALAVAAMIVTVDQSRVLMLAAMPVVVTIAVHAPGPPRRLQASVAVGLLAPLCVSVAGTTLIFGNPFAIAWL
jgi:hypothetical protein